MTQQEILRYARSGIRAERRFCLEMLEKALELVSTYGEAAQNLADYYEHNIADLDAKLKELEKLTNEE